MQYTKRVLAQLEAQYPEQTEFLQAAHEILASVQAVVDQRPEFEDAAILERLVEPERMISFKIVWQDDSGKFQVNRGIRVQYNSALGPYKGGIRFHPSVNPSIIRFLGLEQTLKNALTGLPMGGGKGGSDFNPRGKSEAEILRFCQAYMTELYRHIGANTDVPAGDIGVGAREIGYLYGQYKRIANESTGVLTGKSPLYGGSLGRTEATGHGLLYLVRRLLAERGDSVDGKQVVVSGSGNVAYYAAKKATEMGATVIAMSDSDGWIHDPAGVNLDVLREIKQVRRARISEYTDAVKTATYHEGRGIWSLGCDIALPCATQNELLADDAEALIENGCTLVAEGANMPTSADAVGKLKAAGVTYVPGKASNAGGVAVSGLEMSQNALHLHWSLEEVDGRLQAIMDSIYEQMASTAAAYGREGDYEFGANAAGFLRVAEAMLVLGI